MAPLPGAIIVICIPEELLNRDVVFVKDLERDISCPVDILTLRDKRLQINPCSRDTIERSRSKLELLPVCDVLIADNLTSLIFSSFYYESLNNS